MCSLDSMDDADRERIERLDAKLERVLKLFERFEPLLEKLIANPFLRLGRH